MAVATRGRVVRTISAGNIGALVSIPSALKPMFRDGYDASIVLEVKRHKLRVCLAVSSGGELVIPEYLRELVPHLAQQQNVEEATFYLSTRPLCLVQGEQDDVIRSVCCQGSERQSLSAWDRLSAAERKVVALQWLTNELNASETDS